MLFKVFLEFVIYELVPLKNSNLSSDMTADVRYADDTTLVSAIFQKLQLSTDKLEAACLKWGLKINGTKCKVMSPGRRYHNKWHSC